MPNTPRAFYRGTLTTTANTVVGTVPPERRWVLTNLILSNYGNRSGTVTIMLASVPLLRSTTLTPGSVFTLDCTQPLDPDSKVEAWTDSANTIAMHAAGVEMEK